MPISSTQHKILVLILELQESSSAFIRDQRIADASSLELVDVRDHLELLEKAGLVALAGSTAGFGVQLTAEGRMLLKDPDSIPSAVVSGDTFHMTGDFRGAQVNIKSTLTNVSQTVGATPHVDESLKEELRGLVDQLSEALQQVQPDRVEEAEAVAESAQDLIAAATKEKPNKARIQITADGLKKAAENLAGVMPTVLVIATQIVDTIGRFTGTV